jgi:hypothetical protein
VFDLLMPIAARIESGRKALQDELTFCRHPARPGS